MRPSYTSLCDRIAVHYETLIYTADWNIVEQNWFNETTPGRQVHYLNPNAATCSLSQN